jgi:hypothetical protein
MSGEQQAALDTIEEAMEEGSGSGSDDTGNSERSTDRSSRPDTVPWPTAVVGTCRGAQGTAAL